jgi:lipid II:glycine glycyltransferase (peptidoglycan interpeptide bridge formation enzyme)
LNLQEQLSALKARASETARQLSTARTAAREASEGQQRDQARAAAASVALEEVEAELQHLEK